MELCWEDKDGLPACLSSLRVLPVPLGPALCLLSHSQAQPTPRTCGCHPGVFPAAGGTRILCVPALETPVLWVYSVPKCSHFRAFTNGGQIHMMWIYHFNQL